MRLVVVAAALLFAAPAHAAEDAAAFVTRWLAAQNKGDFAAYQKLYSDGFAGVRSSGKKTVFLNRGEWMRDRERMFRKPMTVAAAGVRSWVGPAGTYVEFEQTWSSESYKDVGKKQLLLLDGPGGFQILREELIGSRRLLLPGQIVRVFLPAANAEEAEAARARFAALTGELRGVAAWPAKVTEEPPGVLLVACDKEGFAEMAATAEALAPRASTRWVKEAATLCPTLRSGGADADERWSWPEVAVARAGKGDLAVFATAYVSTEHGDFGRERRGFYLHALLRDEAGATVATFDGESASDFSALDSIYEDKGKVEVVETYVDAPCDGTRAQPFKRLSRTTVVEADPAAPGTLRTRSRDRTLSKGSCDDSGYRDWVKQMERAK